MAILIKEFHFTSDTEDWVATTGELTIDTGWYPQHRSNGSIGIARKRILEPLLTMGGCLKMTAKQGTSQSKNYWELTKTWEELGVPVGAIVTNVQGDYLYKWDLAVSGAQAKYQNHAEFASGDTNFGPFTLRDSGGTVIDTFSTEVYAIDRGTSFGAVYWKFYPTATAEYPLSYIPNGWGHKVGSNIVVDVANQPSATQVKFRLDQISPPTALWTHGNEPLWVRMKTDYVVLTITYTIPSTGGSKYISGKRLNRLTFTNNSNNIILK